MDALTAMQLALIALETEGYGSMGKHGKAVTALRAAVEDTLKAKPVAWKFQQEHYDSLGGVSVEYSGHKMESKHRHNWQPLYEAPSPQISTLYNELILSVSNKFPNETRHETALRYIRERENQNTQAKSDNEFLESTQKGF